MTADKKKIYVNLYLYISLRGDKTSCPYNLYTATEVINDTIPLFHPKSLQGRHTEALLKKSDLTIEENMNNMTN